MKKILFKVLALVVGKLLARRSGYGAPYYDPYYRGGFFKPYKYKKKKSKLKKLKDLFD